MSPYNTCELDAPSHRFAVLMRSCYYSLHVYLYMDKPDAASCKEALAAVQMYYIRLH